MIHLIYIADPMCSWCYGFGPELNKLLERQGDAQLSLVMGGLRAGNTKIMDAKLKATLHEHWRHVHEASGLPFAADAMAQPGFIYDTEPACRAVVAVRERAADRALDYFHAVQKAFYAEARDVTQGEVLAEVALAVGLPSDEFLAAWHAAPIHAATQQDFATTQRWGITGFPTLVLEHGGKLHAVTVGYTKADDLFARMAEILASPVV